MLKLFTSILVYFRSPHRSASLLPFIRAIGIKFVPSFGTLNTIIRRRAPYFGALILLISAGSYSQQLAGKWTFDNPVELESAATGNNLNLAGVNGSMFNDSTVGIQTPIAGPTTDNGAVRIGVGSHYIMTHGIAPNGGGSKVNQYTLALDVRIPKSGFSYSLYQTNQLNTDPADFWVSHGSRIGQFDLGFSTVTLAPGRWYRLVLSVNLGNWFKYYLDGVLIHEGTSQSVDGRWSLDPNLLLFADNAGYDNPIDVAEVSVWDYPFTDSDASALGTMTTGSHVGRWTFDNASYLDSGAVGSDLLLAGISDSNQNDLNLGTQAAIIGPSRENGASRLGTISHYNVMHGIAPNGGGSKVNQYTVGFDFRVPKLGVWYPLFQTDRFNANDAELYITPNGNIGILDVGYTPVIVTPQKWYRLVVSVNLGSWFRYYLDGVLIYEGASQAIDGRFSLDQILLLFADTDLGDDQIDVAELNLFNYPLTGPEVAALGSVLTQPRAPQGLVVTDSLNQTITLSWQRNLESDFMRYRIYQGVHPDSLILVDSTSGGPGDTLKTFPGLVIGLRYYFRVTAVDSSNDESIYSEEVSATAMMQFTILAGSGSGGTITPNGAVTVNYGTDKRFTIAPVTGYSLSDLQVDGTHVDSTTSYTFKNVTSDHAILANFTINQMTITAIAGAGGTILPNGAVLVNYGDDQKFGIEPNTGYSFGTLLVDGVHVDSTTSYTFRNVTTNHTIAASFTANKMTITATAGPGGIITPDGAVTVDYGESRSFTVAPNTGYSLSDLLVDGTHVDSTTSYTFTNVTANHTIAASFTIRQFTITATAGSGGTITPSGSVSVNYGESRSFTVMPNTGYLLNDLLVDGIHVDSTTSYTFTNVTANHTIAASFAIRQFTITASAGAGGTITPSGSVSVNYGESRSFTVMPNTGYLLNDLLVDGIHVDSATSYTFTNVTANHTIAASFTIRQFTITATAGTGGMITPAGTVHLNYGEDQAFVIEPTSGYVLSNLLVDGTHVDSTTRYTFHNVIANHTIAASFTITQLTITATAGTGGIITPAGTVPVNYGEDQAFVIEPTSGYVLGNLLVDGTHVDSTTSFTFTNVITNHTIAASFTIRQFTITATAGTGGMITPGGAVQVNYGEDQSFEIAPSEGYGFDSLKVDGVRVDSTVSYTFKNVTANHTIHATFTVTKLTIDATAGTGGSITPGGAISVNYNSNQQFTITPNAGYNIDSVIVDGDRVDSTVSYTFINVLENHTIHASFILKTYPITATAGAGGTITPNGTLQVTHGSKQVFSIAPNTGYDIDSVIVDGVRVDSTVSYTFHNVTASHVINAAFGLQQFTITATAGSGGTITPSGTLTVNYGDSVQFIMQPLPGYVVDSLFVDGVYDGNDSVYLFEDISANHTIHVTFTLMVGVGTKPGVPVAYALHQNYPNPFNPVTRVEFDLPQQSTVTVTMYNILGKVVSTVVDHQTLDAGYMNLNIDGSSLASGVYFYRIEAKGADGTWFTTVKKMTLMK